MDDEKQLQEIEVKFEVLKHRVGELKNTYHKAIDSLKADLEQAKKLLSEAKDFCPVLQRNEIDEFLKK